MVTYNLVPAGHRSLGNAMHNSLTITRQCPARRVPAAKRVPAATRSGRRTPPIIANVAISASTISNAARLVRVKAMPSTAVGEGEEAG